MLTADSFRAVIFVPQMLRARARALLAYDRRLAAGALNQAGEALEAARLATLSILAFSPSEVN